jgi:hypothetical protein
MMGIKPQFFGRPERRVVAILSNDKRKPQKNIIYSVHA